MKREAVSYSDGDQRPAKLQQRESSSTVLVNRLLQKSPQPQPPSPLSEYLEDKEHEHTAIVPLSSELNPHPNNTIFEWIPRPPNADELEAMSQPASKRSRSRSISTDRGRPRSVSDASSPSRDAKSSAYKDVNYVTILESKGCFMRPSTAGPASEDLALCERLLHQQIEIPDDTLLEDEFMEKFHSTLRNRSEARLLVDLHPLLMPSAENLYIQGREELKNVIDGYNDPWLKTEPIYGPKPQPDHARGIRWSVFSESQRRKLGIKPHEKSLYAVRDDMYFPYLTAEIKCGTQALEFADRQNMHSMCIALRAVVSLAQAAGCLEQIDRRLLGFSISHDLDILRIYGYYLEIDGDKIQYFRRSIKQCNIWAEDDKWTCYRFVENLDREFLPVHTNRLMHFLGRIPEPQDISFDVNNDHDPDSQASRIGSQESSGYIRATSSQARSLQPELRRMIQSLQQQLDEQKAREEKLAAEQKAREEKLAAEQKAREEKLLAQMEEQKAEMQAQKAREEKLMDRLFSLLERNER